MKSVITLFTAVALVVLLKTDVYGQAAAQPTINNPSPSPPGTPTTGAATTTGTAQPDVNVSAFDPYGVNRRPWFSSSDIRKELNLSDDQYNDAIRDYNSSWQRYNKDLNGLQSNLSDAQRFQRRQELTRRFYNNMATRINDNISDPIARQRYQQLYWQYRGYGAFHDPDVQQQLGLTEAQQQQLSEYGTEWNNRMTTWNRNFPQQRQATTRQFNESRMQAQQRINSTLTPDQQAIWNNMTGQPYSFRPDTYFGSGLSAAQSGPGGTGITTGPNGGPPTSNPGGASGAGAAGAAGAGAAGGAAPK